MMRSDHSQCSHEPFGCGSRIPDNDFHRAAGLCKACALKASRRLRVSYQDLPTALAAYGFAKVGRPEHQPTTDEVWAFIDQLNGMLPPQQRTVQQPVYIHIPEPMRCAPADACLPEGDRAAA
jgi:hypothetical protein